MASTTPTDGIIEDIDVVEEMRNAFLEYSYSVIHSRALPDARDGLKPVHRRILFAMHELGLRPDKGHVKSSRVVGEVMGKYHPHGDSAIYDALVRMSQSFAMRLPLIDGHGNFGSLDDGPAASRYTEARMAPAALLMVTGLDEETVDEVPNYDDSLMQPSVLPAAYPNLLVNGTTGIAVGMATSMPPHNLGEVIAATRHLIKHPGATLDTIMRFIPGPDLPGGGRIIGLEGIHDAYATGRGSFRTRAKASIDKVSPRRTGIVVTELPYLIGPEKVIEKIKEGVTNKKISGISDVKDLSDRSHGLRLVIEVKNGFNPEAVLEQLYKMTPMEDSFGINNVALVGGQPQTLGLLELLKVYIDFRTEVVTRRTSFRLGKRQERLHLVEGLLIAILDIDEVIQLIRSSDTAAIAKERLIQVFDLSDAQASYILDLQLRRLTKFSRMELESERDELKEQIAQLQHLLDNKEALLALVSDELAAVAKEHGTPRRTVLLESAGAPAPSAAPTLEVADDPVYVLLSSTGLVARTTDDAPLAHDGPRHAHDAIVAAVPATARGQVGVLTSMGRIIRLSVLELPTLAASAAAPSLAGGSPLSAIVDLEAGERVVSIVPIAAGAPGLALGTRAGVVKRVIADYPQNKNDWEVIALKSGDEVIGAVAIADDADFTLPELVFITSDAQLLHFGAAAVRPQGRGGSGMAGIRLATGAQAIFFGAIRPGAEAIVVTAAGTAGSLDPSMATSLKVTPFDEYPGKGRATAGVRAHRFLKGEDVLVSAWAGPLSARAAASDGSPVELPAAEGKRDGSGAATKVQIAAIGSIR